jgi:hypothetical protein
VKDRSTHSNYDNYLYLPYARQRAFFGEYVHHCEQLNYPERASESVFQPAYKKLLLDKSKVGINIRLSSGKGSFDKCDICHNADLLLKQSRGWSAAEKSIVEANRRQHIAQQFEDRVKLQCNIADTYNLDHNGQPTKALVFGDGMTVYTGQSCQLLCCCSITRYDFCFY